jgi:hypothetical protein
LIHNNEKLTTSQKLHHLKSSLKGDAASSLKHLSVSDANYEPAWEELKRKYDKKNIIIHIENIMEQKTLTHFSAVHIKRLTNTTSESIRALACLEAMKSWDNILIYVISNKMDPEPKQLWARRIASVDEPTY